MDETIAVIALQRTKGIEYRVKRRLLEEEESIGGLIEGKGRFSKEVSAKIASFDGWKDIDGDLKKINTIGAKLVTIRDSDYPALLRTIPDAPLVLYAKGKLEVRTDTIAIVGSRKASFESMNMAEKIAQTLSSVGITVVSGLARGVDAASHRGALKEKGKTVGVLGCGIDICYPSENKPLFEKVGTEGCILTKYSPGEPPIPGHFPARNRIIAGLSKGVLVVEASHKSGSLITARLGLEYGREVMAIPGNVFDEGFKGANALIKQGAKLVDGIDDIIATCFPNLTVKKDKQVDLNENERYIYGVIGPVKMHIDEVIEKSGMEARHVMATLTSLELKDKIRGIPGGFYIRQ